MLKILGALWRMNLQAMLAYRANAVADLVIGLMWLGVELFGIRVIMMNTQSIGGWSMADMLLLLGVWKVLMTLAYAIIAPNSEAFNQAVRDGTLDYVFLLPVSSQFVVSLQRLNVTSLHSLLQGMVLIPLGLSMGQHTVTAFSMAQFGLLCVCGMITLYSIWILLLAAVFWFTRFDNNATILFALADAGRFPTSAFPAWLRALLTFVIPIGLATTVPIQALRGELDLWQMCLFLLAGASAFAISHGVWNAGTRKYSGASA